MTPQYRTHDFQEWLDVQADRLAPVKRQGNEYHSACPICGDGEDRHWIKEGDAGQVLAKCRQCEAP